MPTPLSATTMDTSVASPVPAARCACPGVVLLPACSEIGQGLGQRGLVAVHHHPGSRLTSDRPRCRSGWLQRRQGLSHDVSHGDGSTVKGRVRIRCATGQQLAPDRRDAQLLVDPTLANLRGCGRRQTREEQKNGLIRARDRCIPRPTPIDRIALRVRAQPGSEPKTSSPRRRRMPRPNSVHPLAQGADSATASRPRAPTRSGPGTQHPVAQRAEGRHDNTTPAQGGRKWPADRQRQALATG